MKVLAWPIAEVAPGARFALPSGDQNFAHLVGEKAQAFKLSDGRVDPKDKGLARGLMTSPHQMLTLGQGDASAGISAGPTVLPENLPAASQMRTFRLDELGVFGISGAVAAAAQVASASAPAAGVERPAGVSPAAASPSAQSALSLILGGLGSTITGALVTIAGGAGVADPAGDPRIGAEASDLGLPATEGNPATGWAEVGRATDQAANVDAEQAAGPTAPPDKASLVELDRQRLTGVDRPLSLLVSETNGAIQVVAAAPGVNGAELGRLRRLIEDTATQFGKRIQGVQLNGAPVDMPPPTPIGAQT